MNNVFKIVENKAINMFINLDKISAFLERVYTHTCILDKIRYISIQTELI